MFVQEMKMGWKWLALVAGVFFVLGLSVGLNVAWMVMKG